MKRIMHKEISEKHLGACNTNVTLALSREAMTNIVIIA